MSALFDFLFSAFMLTALGSMFVFAAKSEERSSDQMERDRIARHVELHQTTEGRVLHLRRGHRIP